MSRAETGTASVYHRTVVYLLFIILLLPLLGTFVYSIASSWSATVLPSGFTFKWYLQLWSDPRFLTAFGHSLLICFGALLLSVVLILPLLFVVHYHFPKLDVLMNILILLPFAVPPVVSSVGLLQLYGSGPMAMVGTRYETLQVFLNNMRNSSGHFTSALVISYFLFVLVLTWVATFLNKDKSQ